MTKLFRVEVTYVAFVEADDEDEASETMEDTLLSGDVDWMTQERLDVTELRAPDAVPPEWRDSLPFRDSSRRGEPERTCVQVLEATKKQTS